MSKSTQNVDLEAKKRFVMSYNSKKVSSKHLFSLRRYVTIIIITIITNVYGEKDIQVKVR